jgi:beta-galactosidase/beta-glucuronidase
VYTKEVTLEEKPRAGKVVLDLGRVATTAEVHVNGKPAGVGMARPYRFDVTHLVEEGPNQIQVKVVNSLANHMSTYPTKYVLEGQTVSGLLGPVELRFLSEAVFKIAN